MTTDSLIAEPHGLAYVGKVDPRPGTEWFGMDGRKVVVLGTVFADGKSTVFVECEPATKDRPEFPLLDTVAAAVAKAYNERHVVTAPPITGEEYLVDGEWLTEDALKQVVDDWDTAELTRRRFFEHVDTVADDE